LELRAVVFDYGMVLSGLPDPAAWAAMRRITGLAEERFKPLYWADRTAYDEGTLTGVAFWRNFLRRAGLPEEEAMAEDLNRWDCRFWTVYNPAMVAWQLALKERGLLTAICSNMGDSTLASVEGAFDWIHRFDVLMWSCQLGVVKPDPAIYRLTLAELNKLPEETLFIDDKRENVEAARALGIRAIQFSSVEHLRQELTAAGLAKELPLPD
jgi:putative hydrolase of the HAD superfamily